MPKTPQSCASPASIGVFACTLVSLLCLPAQAEPNIAVDSIVALRGWARDNIPQTTLRLSDATLSPWDFDGLYDADDPLLYPALIAQLNLDAEFTPWLSFELYLDSSEIRPGSIDDDQPDPPTVSASGRSIGEHFADGTFLRAAALHVHSPDHDIALGKTRHTIGHGLVYDDFSTGLRASSSWGDNGLFNTTLLAHIVGDSFDEMAALSPLFAIHTAYAISWFESVEVFGSLFWDRGGLLRSITDSIFGTRLLATGISEDDLQQAITEQLLSPDPSGTIATVGTAWHVLPNRWLRAYGSLALQWGILDATAAIRNGSGDIVTAERRLDILAWAGFAAFDIALPKAHSMGVLLLALSGDTPPRLLQGETLDYRGFVGVAPFWTFTNLFFSGGLGQDLTAGRPQTAGINGHGVLGAGPTWSWGRDRSEVEARVIALQAFERRLATPNDPEGGRFYGVEWDITGRYALTDWLFAGLEVDTLWPGSFFPSRALAWQVLGQIDVVYAR